MFLAIYVMKGTANLFNYYLLCLKFTIVFELIHTTIIFSENISYTYICSQRHDKNFEMDMFIMFYLANGERRSKF